MNVTNGTASGYVSYKPEFNCSIPSSFEGTTEESGNVFEKTLSYPVVLRYSGFFNKVRGVDTAHVEDIGIADHVGTFTVRFCVIKIPSMCDPFFKYTYDDTLGGKLFGSEVYDPESCRAGGIPII
ncbi:Uncharacterised protein [Candidatus Tiddalikarchaeum anstoanum]|nr:Uncharacterised protein [Candidatus Tiddalikarchaeum anstoanum]